LLLSSNLYFLYHHDFSLPQFYWMECASKRILNLISLLQTISQHTQQLSCVLAMTQQIELSPYGQSKDLRIIKVKWIRMLTSFHTRCAIFKLFAFSAMFGREYYDNASNIEGDSAFLFCFCHFSVILHWYQINQLRE